MQKLGEEIWIHPMAGLGGLVFLVDYSHVIWVKEKSASHYICILYRKHALLQKGQKMISHIVFFWTKLLNGWTDFGKQIIVRLLLAIRLKYFQKLNRYAKIGFKNPENRLLTCFDNTKIADLCNLLHRFEWHWVNMYSICKCINRPLHSYSQCSNAREQCSQM